jgi:hypothetical protein
MLLYVFIAFIVLALTLIYLGYLLKDSADIFKIVGFGFIFVLGVMLIPGTPGEIIYANGDSVTQVVYNNPINDSHVADHTITKTQTHYVFEDFFFGFYLAIIGIFGFINVFVTMKKRPWI